MCGCLCIRVWLCPTKTVTALQQGQIPYGATSYAVTKPGYKSPICNATALETAPQPLKRVGPALVAPFNLDRSVPQLWDHCVSRRMVATASAVLLM